MIRTTITIDEDLTSEVDSYMERSGASNRSEAIRDLLRRGLSSLPIERDEAPCVGIISYTVNQTIAGLSKRIRETRMNRHDEVIFTSSVPINHTNSIDIMVMSSSVQRVNDYAQSLFLERGIKHGVVALTPVQEELQHHSHDDDDEPRAHVHLKVQESF